MSNSAPESVIGTAVVRTVVYDFVDWHDARTITHYVTPAMASTWAGYFWVVLEPAHVLDTVTRESIREVRRGDVIVERWEGAYPSWGEPRITVFLGRIPEELCQVFEGLNRDLCVEILHDVSLDVECFLGIDKFGNRRC